MPRVEATVVVPVRDEIAFAVAQTQGEIRYRWDPFLKSQEHIGGGPAARGVRTNTISRHRLRMISEYTSFRPPTQTGMKMVEGPWFFKQFAGGWTFTDLGDEQTRVTWRYTFSIRPVFLRPIVDRIGLIVLQRDLDRRLRGFAKGCTDPIVIKAVTEVIR